MSIQENTLVFRRSLLHLVVIGSIIHQSISFLSRGHSTPLCPALPCVTLLREALVYFYLQKLVPIQPKTSNILPKFCQPTLSGVDPFGSNMSSARKEAEKSPERSRTAADAGAPQHPRHVTRCSQNFGKMLLVFGCIGTDFCKEIRVLQHFQNLPDNLADFF